LSFAAAGTTAGFLSGCASAPPARQLESHADLSVLPRGTEPSALHFQHFPSRLHAFVWRNWSLVPAATMATLLGCSTKQVQQVARAIGLGRQPAITEDQRRRSYITVIKRNWHLLPYEQLLQLLGWNAEELAFVLREDDFLWIKLGSLKPKCEPLRWNAADAARQTNIPEVLREEFGAVDVAQPHDPLFAFVSRLSRPIRGEAVARNAGGLRFCYSYFALYGDPLLDPARDPYPDGLLQRLSAAGVNGVWLQAVLHKMAPFPWAPALSARFDDRLKNLRQLVARAAGHGIKVFLYLNEPRAMPLRFFDAHPELKGVTEAEHATLCTSRPEVRAWLTESVSSICRAVPALGGFFTITASENLTNCWSHGAGKSCRSCASRPPSEVIADVNAALYDGVLRAGTGQRFLAWDWGWADAWAPDVIARLPASVALMSVSEWNLPIERGGVKGVVGEYSISAIGPGPRSSRHWKLAKERGLEIVAKIQSSSTWELSALPWIPVAANVAEHARRLRELNLDGVMLGWTLGGYPSPNLEAVAEVMNGGTLETIAQRRFGADLAFAFVRAWQALRNAFAEFPYHIGVVYNAPQQNGPSNLLWERPTGFKATMVGFPYDDLHQWRAHYPPEIFAAQMEMVADGFDQALATLKAEVRGISNAAGSEEMTMIRAAAIHWRSVAIQSRFVMTRDALAKSGSPADADTHLLRLEELISKELALARELFALQSRDSRIGFEASNQYYYVPMDLVEKVLNCRDLLERWLPAERIRASAKSASSRSAAGTRS
jgi:hypothetical protein